MDQVADAGLVPVGQGSLRAPDRTEPDKPGLDAPGQVGGLGVGPGQQQHVLPAQVVREPHRRRPLAGGFGVGAPNAAVPVVGGDRSQVAVPEPDTGLPLPLRLEPADLVQLRGGDFPSQQGEHSPGLDRTELRGVAGGGDPRPGLPGRLTDQGEVGGAELAGLIQHEHVVAVQRHGAAELVGAFGLAEELGDVVALGQALVLQDPRGVRRGGQADDPAGLLVRNELRHRPFRGGEDLLFGVQVSQRAVPLLVRWPVDAAAVGGPDAQAGHVGDVRGGDLDDVGAGPAADGQVGHLGDIAASLDGRFRTRKGHGASDP
jgi:hypothetical protein